MCFSADRDFIMDCELFSHEIDQRLNSNDLLVDKDEEYLYTIVDKIAIENSQFG